MTKNIHRLKEQDKKLRLIVETLQDLLELQPATKADYSDEQFELSKRVTSIISSLDIQTKEARSIVNEIINK